MEPVYEKSKEQRNLLEKILICIPGFRGYLQKEWRRESDKLEREFISEEISTAKNELRRIMQDLTGSGKLDVMNVFEKVDSFLEKLSNKIKHVDHGYSGFFDVVKIREDELEKIYQYDLFLIDTVKKIKPSIMELKKYVNDPPSFAEKLKQVYTQLEDLEKKFYDREKVIFGN